MRHKMNGDALAIPTTNVRPIRGQELENEEQEKLSWIHQRLVDVGVLMSVQPKSPPGFYVNWTTITGIILVVSTIAGLWYFTWQTAELRGIEKGKAEAERQRMENELEAMRKRVFVVEEKQKLEQQK